MCKKLSIQQCTKEQGIVFTLGTMWARYGATKNKKDSRAAGVQCFTQETIKKIMERVRPGFNFKSVCLVHDFALQLVPELLKINPEAEITVAYDTSFAGTNSNNLFNYIVYYLKGTFKQFPNIKFVKVENLIDMEFDLIIANPPYGSIGADITKNIIKNVKFKQYINLLPAKDYLNSSDGDLFKYQYNLVNLPAGMFEDTDVKTSIAEISATSNGMTEVDFQVSCFVDSLMLKYFKHNISKDNIFSTIDRSGKSPTTWDIDRTIIAGWADTQSGHIVTKKSSPTYRWNRSKDITQAELIKNYNRPRAVAAGSYELCFYAFTFDNKIKKDNFITFMYSKLGMAFINRLYKAMNTNGRKCHEYLWVFPKVDWTRAWTVEEILEDYGYTETEITAVMADLKNFKDMEK